MQYPFTSNDLIARLVLCLRSDQLPPCHRILHRIFSLLWVKDYLFDADYSVALSPDTSRIRGESHSPTMHVLYSTVYAARATVQRMVLVASGGFGLLTLQNPRTERLQKELFSAIPRDKLGGGNVYPLLMRSDQGSTTDILTPSVGVRRSLPHGVWFWFHGSVPLVCTSKPSTSTITTIVVLCILSTIIL